jgi:hypothetical protein
MDRIFEPINSWGRVGDLWCGDEFRKMTEFKSYSAAIEGTIVFKRRVKTAEKVFIDRFMMHMILRSASFYLPNGTSVIEYARTIAPVYWVESQLVTKSPEEFADDDIAYWPSDFS